jgi:type I pantothenate kinase
VADVADMADMADMPAIIIPPEVISRISVLKAQQQPVVVGVAGAVAVGKSTFASALAAATGGVTISTDGFLFSNDELEAAGLIERKGFPESFDLTRLVSFLQALRIAEPTGSSEPIGQLMRYSHETFDIEPDPQPFVRRPVVIIEGVNALQPDIAKLLDFRIYLDADEADIIGWYTYRFTELTEQARRTNQGFYTRFADQSPYELTQTAQLVWDMINAPNLHDCIEPTKAAADIVICKRADHSFA